MFKSIHRKRSSRNSTALSGVAHRVGVHNLRQAIAVTRIGVSDVRLGLPQLCLAEFDNRAEPQVVTLLRQIQRQVRLLAQLLRDREPTDRLILILPRAPHVAPTTLSPTHPLLPPHS